MHVAVPRSNLAFPPLPMQVLRSCPGGGATKIMRIGIDLGKNAFEAFGVDERENLRAIQAVESRTCTSLLRPTPADNIRNRGVPTIHHWIRKLTALGHEVRQALASAIAVTGAGKATGVDRYLPLLRNLALGLAPRFRG
jgi:hypothetical protein